MHPIRSARRVRGLTIVELAQLSGVSARTIGMFEQGMLLLDSTNAEQLATALSVPVTLLMCAAAVTPGMAQPPNYHALTFVGIPRLVAFSILFAILLVGASIALDWPGVIPIRQVQASIAQRPQLAVAGFVAPATRPQISQVEPTPIPTPSATPQPSATIPPTDPAPTIASDRSPHACPLLAEPPRVVISQGYGQGTHAPVTSVGAIDLAIDSDGDGYGDPDATNGVVILATHTGIVRVWADTWPGGNVIRIVDQQSGWNTLYAHLAEISVTDGQAVTMGMPLGTVGSTGMSSGPHLHYEIWHFGENRDPTNMAPCWRVSR